MRQSQLFGATLHVAPGQSESEGHQMLQRAAMVRQVAQGIFAYLPLGWRSIRKIEEVVRSEMEAIGAEEISMPVVNPADIWKQSGRYYKIGPELARFRDRRGRDMVLAMTHEEVVTGLARTEIESYRQLPRMVFQFQTKFRDDARPRAGLIRVREFIMKDAYSIAADEAGLDVQYRAQYQAYLNIFRRCGLPVRAVASDVGMMGGSLAHEFQYLTDVGEDTLLFCDACGFAANMEVAQFRKPEPAAATAKAVFLAADREEADGSRRAEFIVAVVRGDTDVNENKLGNVVKAAELRPMTDDEIASIGAVAGSGSPIGITGATVVVDDLVARSANLTAGANKDGYHVRNVNLGRDFAADHVGDITAARAGDGCPDCGSPMRTRRGVEVGQIFKLGTRYSADFGATFLDADGQRRPVIMGCYGIGIGRLLGCAAQEHRDEMGLRLPVSIAPYHVHLCLLDGVDSPAGEEAARIYRELWASGVEVLLDDREERAGVKFADADLIGLPLRLTLGQRSFAAGTIELRDRATGETVTVPLADVVAAVQQRLAMLRAAIAG